MRRAAAFTLIEIMLAVFIILLIVLVAVPSIEGVLADQRKRAGFEKFDELVQRAHALSQREQRTYLLVWEMDMSGGFQHTVIVLRPESPATPEEANGVMTLSFTQDEKLTLELPAALVSQPEPAWAFWPSGTCEPANISYSGPNGGWSASYDPLTAQGEFSMQ